MAIINYEWTVSVELQEPEIEITEIGVVFNKGFGMADTFIYIPIFIIALIGIFKEKIFGIFFMFGFLSITAYWPVVCLSAVFFANGSPNWHFTDYTFYSIILSLITIYGIWGIFYLLKSIGLSKSN